MTVITKLELGGAQQVALQTLAGLSRDRYRLYLVSGRGGLLDEQAQALPGVDVHRWQSFKHPIRPLSDLVTCIRLARFMRRERIQIVHTHSSKAGLLGRVAAGWAGVPVVLHTVHGWPFHDYQPAPIRFLYICMERWAARRTTRLIAVSGATRDKGLKNRIGREDQYRIIFPGSDLSAFAPATSKGRKAVRAEFGFEADAPVVGMVACLKPQKAPEDFVAAAQIVLETMPQARFLLVGDGKLQAAVKARIAQLGLRQQVVMAGWRQDVPRLMGAFDVLAHSSLWEGLPCVFAQAHASGLPVAATDVEGAREIIAAGQTGVLVPPARPRALAQAVLQLLQDEPARRKMGAAARERARQFDLPVMLAKLNELYQAEWSAQSRSSRPVFRKTSKSE